ncbi:MAG: 5-formyltetrahydrofolate cyclo-ligase [Firmicutes bacterium]|nr:5-formyltetrahydrofolate cyclo-ligase [Bacillota bacterium]
MNDTKSALRLQYLKIRAEIPDRAARSAAIAERLFASDAYVKASEVLTFAGFGSEADTLGIIRRALADGKVVALPVARAGRMRFYRIFGPEELTPSARGPAVRGGGGRSWQPGIPEPVPDPANEVLCGPKTLLLVPGIVMDKSGYRIGYGGGYYDRYMAVNRPMVSVGLCFAAQVAEAGAFAPEAHDAPVDAVLTEEGWILPYA